MSKKGALLLNSRLKSVLLPERSYFKEQNSSRKLGLIFWVKTPLLVLVCFKFQGSWYPVIWFLICMSVCVMNTSTNYPCVMLALLEVENGWTQ